MKILVVAPTPFFADRGTHIRILEEALALEKFGHSLTIATYHIGREISPEIKTKIEVRRIRRLLFWYKKLEAGPDWQKVILDIMLIRKVFNLARTQKPDVIHGHLHEGVLIGWIVQKCLFWRRIKLVADFHGSLTREMVSHDYLKGAGGILRKIFVQIEKFIDNLGDAVITSSAENTQEIKGLRHDGIVETVLDGVNLSRFQDLPEKIESKKELELPLDRRIVIYTGALMPNKGTSNLYQAILEVKKSAPRTFFVIAGFPADEAQRFIEANNLEHDARLISPLKYFHLPELLNASDVAVDPKDSTTRQASGKILQYMGAGLPIVCYNRPNNRHYLAEGGIYAEKPDAKSLAEKIVFALDNLELSEEKGLENRRRARLFSWYASAKQIDAIYKKLTTKK
jgi:glycosyltransferase involved in cell wall biosynthesis